MMSCTELRSTHSKIQASRALRAITHERARRLRRGLPSWRVRLGIKAKQRCVRHIFAERVSEDKFGLEVTRRFGTGKPTVWAPPGVRSAERSGGARSGSEIISYNG